MKKILKFSILSLIILALVGCSSSDEDDAKKVAEKFVVNIHTVDDTKVAEYKKLVELATSISEGFPEGTITDLSEEYANNIQSLDKNIQSLMTNEGYESIIMNRFNLISTIACEKNNYTTKVTDFILGENLYEDDKNIDKFRYFYEATMTFSSNDGLDEWKDVVKGYIELLEEDGKWRVCIYTITAYPKTAYLKLGD